MPEEKRCGKYDHVEAFCTMQYECQTCRTIETLWNSRDGVTPFIIQCQQCDGEMNHGSFEFDECVPDYFPRKGMRVFVDFPEHFREVFKRRFILTNWDGLYPMSERFKTKQEALQILMSDEMQEGEPYVLKL